jgi:uncharacterized protein (TIGR04141 family)
MAKPFTRASKRKLAGLVLHLPAAGVPVHALVPPEFRIDHRAGPSAERACSTTQFGVGYQRPAHARSSVPPPRIAYCFDWVDHLRPVKDKDLCGVLDLALLGAIQAQDADHVYLAPPEIIDWEDYDGIRFGTAKKTEPAEFEIESFYAYMKDPMDWDLERLRKAGLSLVRRAEGVDDRRFTLYRCLIFDHAHGNERYVLTNGGWYNIEADFAAKVTGFVADLQEATLDLPQYDPAIDTRESEYTARACANNQAFALMDQKNVKPTNARTLVEVCDIFTEAGQFVHIKPFKASSTLSHLFSQGAVSAELFQCDPGYRSQARKKVISTRRPLGTLIPSKSGIITVAPFEVVFAVIWKDHAEKGPWQTALPFFAQLNLMQVAQRLQMKNFRVSMKLIKINNALSAQRGPMAPSISNFT